MRKPTLVSGSQGLCVGMRARRRTADWPCPMAASLRIVSPSGRSPGATSLRRPETRIGRTRPDRAALAAAARPESIEQLFSRSKRALGGFRAFSRVAEQSALAIVYSGIAKEHAERPCVRQSELSRMGQSRPATCPKCAQLAQGFASIEGRGRGNRGWPARASRGLLTPKPRGGARTSWRSEADARF